MALQLAVNMGPGRSVYYKSLVLEHWHVDCKGIGVYELTLCPKVYHFTSLSDLNLLVTACVFHVGVIARIYRRHGAFAVRFRRLWELWYVSQSFLVLGPTSLRHNVTAASSL